MFYLLLSGTIFFNLSLQRHQSFRNKKNKALRFFFNKFFKLQKNHFKVIFWSIKYFKLGVFSVQYILAILPTPLKVLELWTESCMRCLPMGLVEFSPQGDGAFCQLHSSHGLGALQGCWAAISCITGIGYAPEMLGSPIYKMMSVKRNELVRSEKELLSTSCALQSKTKL